MREGYLREAGMWYDGWHCQCDTSRHIWKGLSWLGSLRKKDLQWPPRGTNHSRGWNPARYKKEKQKQTSFSLLPGCSVAAASSPYCLDICTVRDFTADLWAQVYFPWVLPQQLLACNMLPKTDAVLNMWSQLRNWGEGAGYFKGFIRGWAHTWVDSASQSLGEEAGHQGCVSKGHVLSLSLLPTSWDA